MHIMVTTDGGLDPTMTSETVERFAQPGDRITVLTVIEIPRALLSDLRAFYERRDVIQGTDTDNEYVSSTHMTTVSPSWPGDDALLDAFIQQQKENRTRPLVDALTTKGLAVEAVALEGTDPTRPILQAVEELAVDLLCVGSRGRGMFEGLLGSTSTRLARRAPCPVLLLRP
ncbi:MAG: universal stress protein [Acidimicrobiia bacterium]